LTEPGFNDALIGVLAVGRWWHITTLQARPYDGAIAVAKVFGDPFWSLTLCDRLQKDVHYDVNDLNQRFDAIQIAHTIAIDNLRHDFETASKTVKSDDVNRHIDARTVAAAPYTAILKTHVKVMRELCERIKHHKHTTFEEAWQRLETMKTLLQKSLTQLDTMDTDFQDEVDEKISTAQAEYTDELDARIDAVRAEYTTEIAELREALERQQTQQREASALRETLERDTIQASHSADLTKFRQEIESAADARIDAVRADYITEAKCLAQTCEVADAIRAEYTTEIAVLREALERQQAQHRQAIAQLVRKLDQR
jgi:paraquat-inducible protein B